MSDNSEQRLLINKSTLALLSDDTIYDITDSLQTNGVDAIIAGTKSDSPGAIFCEILDEYLDRKASEQGVSVDEMCENQPLNAFDYRQLMYRMVEIEGPFWLENIVLKNDRQLEGSCQSTALRGTMPKDEVRKRAKKKRRKTRRFHGGK